MYKFDYFCQTILLQYEDFGTFAVATDNFLIMMFFFQIKREEPGDYKILVKAVDSKFNRTKLYKAKWAVKKSSSLSSTSLSIFIHLHPSLSIFIHLYPSPPFIISLNKKINIVTFETKC